MPLLLQSFVAGMALLGLVRHVIDPVHTRRFAATTLATFVLAAATPLPFFASFLMPDLFTGLAVLAAAALLTGWWRERVAWRVAWSVLLAAAALFHASNILLLGALGIGGLAIATTRRRPAMLATPAALVAAALVGVAGERAFDVAVRAVTSHAPIRPPFITVRLVADGPGMDHLARSYATETYRLCRYHAVLPQPSDTFLWSSDPANGVFMRAPAADQRVLAQEQERFVLAVVTAQPLAVVASSSRALARQVAEVGLGEFNYPADTAAALRRKLPPAESASVARTRAYRGTMPTAPSVVLTILLAAAAVTLIVIAARRQASCALAGYGLVVLTGWLLNDAICGMLSTPHERYQMRVLWALPVAALLLAIAVAGDPARWRRWLKDSSYA